MTCVTTWHLWKCDECGTQSRLEHGQLAEPQIPAKWHQAFGWGVHACSKKCKNDIQKKHQAETGKLYIWRESKELK